MFKLTTLSNYLLGIFWSIKRDLKQSVLRSLSIRIPIYAYPGMLRSFKTRFRLTGA